MKTNNFYSHASCEARHARLHANCDEWAFLLTRLLRGATSTPTRHTSPTGISTHTPLARRDGRMMSPVRSRYNFYSHASCEARLEKLSAPTPRRSFLLTRLLRGAT